MSSVLRGLLESSRKVLHVSCISSPVASPLLGPLASVLANQLQVREKHSTYNYKIKVGGKYKDFGGKKSPRHMTNPYIHKPLQEWWDWDGKGPYKYRHHHYPSNITLRDVQRRRIFKKHHCERERLNAIRKNDILPKELQELAWKEVNDMPLDSSIVRPNFRCTVTGRGRGNYYDFRVSRFVFRKEADYNKISGVQRAFWLYNTKINP